MHQTFSKCFTKKQFNTNLRYLGMNGPANDQYLKHQERKTVNESAR